jgi:hypothetical protein
MGRSMRLSYSPSALVRQWASLVRRTSPCPRTCPWTGQSQVLRCFRWKGYWAVAHRAKHFGLSGLPGANLPLGRKSGFGYSGCSQRAGPAFHPGASCYHHHAERGISLSPLAGRGPGRGVPALECSGVDWLPNAPNGLLSPALSSRGGEGVLPKSRCWYQAAPVPAGSS